jgi:hypothetical protein
VDSTPQAYRLKASNAAPPISTSAGTSPIERMEGILREGTGGSGLAEAHASGI